MKMTGKCSIKHIILFPMSLWLDIVEKFMEAQFHFPIPIITHKQESGIGEVSLPSHDGDDKEISWCLALLKFQKGS